MKDICKTVEIDGLKVTIRSETAGKMTEEELGLAKAFARFVKYEKLRISKRKVKEEGINF